MSSLAQNEQEKSQEKNAPSLPLSVQFHTPPSTPTPIPTLEEQVYTGGVAEENMVEQVDTIVRRFLGRPNCISPYWFTFEWTIEGENNPNYLNGNRDLIVINVDDEVGEEKEDKELEQEEQEEQQQDEAIEEQDIQSDDDDDDDQSDDDDDDDHDDDNDESDIEDIGEVLGMVDTPPYTDIEDSNDYFLADPDIPPITIDSPDASDEE
ncbi:unnamed protein product [Rotaria sp. Silwood2]|nr:unnamed protein product [Rotaria sp. Silwood2]CAF4302194.1 unnamed protein product [Rotaria sp. Silwood2]